MRLFIKFIKGHFMPLQNKSHFPQKKKSIHTSVVTVGTKASPGVREQHTEGSTNTGKAAVPGKHDVDTLEGHNSATSVPKRRLCFGALPDSASRQQTPVALGGERLCTAPLRRNILPALLRRTSEATDQTKFFSTTKAGFSSFIIEGN